ncbi:MAG: hypothetical protein MUE46_03395 [Xanthomonadales bacterium]|jgi:hypothetical protein|nr:hypothetical protein [Xanthomonadales bacterium]
MFSFRPALFDAPSPARYTATLTLFGLLLLPWTLTLPDSVFGAWWVMTTWLPALATVVLAPRESWATLRGLQAWCMAGRSASAESGSRRWWLPRAGQGAVRVRLRRSQGVRRKRRSAA